jgi:hypothetical protein
VATHSPLLWLIHSRSPARWLALAVGVAALVVLLATMAAWVLGPAGANGAREAAREPPREERGEAVPGGEGTVHPGVLSVTDAAPWGEEWVILDGRSSRWHRVDASGRLVLTAARNGRGPGELDRPSALAVVGDTVVVAERTLGTVELFLVDGTPLGRRRLPADGCPAGWVRSLAALSAGLYMMRECLDGVAGGTLLRVERVDWAGEGEEGTGVLLASRAGLDLTGADPVRPGRPLLAGGGGLLLFGDAREGCVRVLVGGGGGAEEFCHPEPPLIPLPEEEQAAAAVTQRAMAGAGVRMVIPAHRVPFDDLYILDGSRVVFRTVLEGERRRFDLVGPEGWRTLPVGEATPISHVGPRSMLLAAEEFDGTRIRVVPFH